MLSERKDDPPRFEERLTKSPGPRTRVTLDVAEVGLADLVKGIHPTRCWLEPTDDGAYFFRATQTIGESRRQGGKPAADHLIELINELGEALEADDVPPRLRELWSDLVDRYNDRTVAP